MPNNNPWFGLRFYVPDDSGDNKEQKKESEEKKDLPQENPQQNPYQEICPNVINGGICNNLCPLCLLRLGGV